MTVIAAKDQLIKETSSRKKLTGNLRYQYKRFK
jgi:hypothetical protein